MKRRGIEGRRVGRRGRAGIRRTARADAPRRRRAARHPAPHRVRFADRVAVRHARAQVEEEVQPGVVQGGVDGRRGRDAPARVPRPLAPHGQPRVRGRRPARDGAPPRDAPAGEPAGGALPDPHLTGDGRVRVVGRHAWRARRLTVRVLPQAVAPLGEDRRGGPEDVRRIDRRGGPPPGARPSHSRHCARELHEHARPTARALASPSGRALSARRRAGHRCAAAARRAAPTARTSPRGTT